MWRRLLASCFLPFFQHHNLCFNSISKLASLAFTYYIGSRKSAPKLSCKFVTRYARKLGFAIGIVVFTPYLPHWTKPFSFFIQLSLGHLPRYSHGAVYHGGHEPRQGMAGMAGAEEPAIATGSPLHQVSRWHGLHLRLHLRVHYSVAGRQCSFRTSHIFCFGKKTSK